MMDGGAPSGPQVPWQSILVLVTGLGGVLFYYHGLQSERPPDVSTHAALAIGYEDVEARNWQDPFDAARNFDDALKSQKPHHPRGQTSAAGGENGSSAAVGGEPSAGADAAHALPSLRYQIDAANGSLRVLGVMVPGGPYAELAENRLRARAAVLEGLFVAGYELTDEDHIGYINVTWPQQGADVEAGDPRHDRLLHYLKMPDATSEVAQQGPQVQLRRLTIPYEWLRKSRVPIASHLPGGTDSQILVLWLDEDAFVDVPLSRVAALVEALNPGRSSDTAWKVIGPRTSTTLSNLVLGASEIGEKAKTALNAVTFYAATPGEQDELILDELPPKPAHGQTVVDYLFSAARVRLVKIGISDDDLCWSLVNELHGRGLDIPQPPKGDPGSDIAIISESDTRYGRALPLTFAAIASSTNLDDLVTSPSGMPAWIHTVTYLRGVDGRTAEKSSGGTPPTASDADSKAPASKLSEPGELPVGQNQADYLRRLADQLAQLNDSLVAQHRRLGAVGVLGTDVYDKLLILQAIRDRLPGVVFFTTGLDTAYTTRQASTATHNLLIASSFGLRLHAFYQNSVPPFRDSAQTAIFTATLVASGAISQDIADLHPPRKPRLFEISRLGAFDITTGDEGNLDPDGPAQETRLGAAPPTIYPPRFDLTSPKDHGVAAGLCAMAVCLAAMIVALMFWSGVRPSRFNWEKLTASISAFLLFAAGTAFVAWLLWPRTAAGEPVALWAGISTWPSEALRIFAGLFSLQLVWRSVVERRINDRKVERLFGLRPLTKSRQALRRDGSGATRSVRWMENDAGSVRKLSGWSVFGNTSGKRDTRADLSGEAAEGTIVYAQNLWWEYQRRGMTRARVERIVPQVLLTIAAFMVLGAIIHFPNDPARTETARTADRIIIFLSAVPFYFLTYWVMDGAYTNVLFMNYLTRTKTQFSSLKFKKLLPKGVAMEDVTDRLDILLIAKRTHVAGEVVYYPFFVLALMIAARCPLLADWDWPPFIIILFSVNIVLAMIAAGMLRHAAEAARRTALHNIDNLRVKYVAAGESEKVDFMKEMEQRVRNEREGAFSVLSQYPWLGALLLPSGSLGLWAILQYLPQLLRP